jgi:hypothetical protein
MGITLILYILKIIPAVIAFFRGWFFWAPLLYLLPVLVSLGSAFITTETIKNNPIQHFHLVWLISIPFNILSLVGLFYMACNPRK